MNLVVPARTKLLVVVGYDQQTPPRYTVQPFHHMTLWCFRAPPYKTQLGLV